MSDIFEKINEKILKDRPRCRVCDKLLTDTLNFCSQKCYEKWED